VKGFEDLSPEEAKGSVDCLTALCEILRTVGKRRGFADTMPCPCCEGGTLRYSVASYNGHIHAACSTPGCVRFMQ
jgi:hypothetical protein